MSRSENPKEIWAYVTNIPYRRLEAGTVPNALEQDVRDGVDATVSEYVRADTERGKLEVEVTRLRAALAEIAALQTEEPESTDGEDLEGECGGQTDDAYALGWSDGAGSARWELANIARRAIATEDVSS